MFEFWFKILQLTRPYRGRFILAVLCGSLSGMADTAVMLTVAIVAGAVFPGGFSTVSVEEIKDLPGIVDRLRQHSDPVSGLLWQQLSTSQQSLLRNYQPSSLDSNQVQTVVAQTLNKTIGGRSIYDPARFKGIPLRPETLGFLTNSRVNPNTAQLNRLLLEDAYPGELSRSVSGSAKLPSKVPPWAMRLYQSVQNFFAPNPNSRFGVLWLVSLIPLVMLVRGVVNYLSSYLMSWVAVRAICDLRAHLFEHLLNQPLSFLSRITTGELMSRVGGDVGLLQVMIGVSIVTLIREPVNVVTMSIIPLAISWRFTLIALVTLPLCIVPVAIYNRKVRKSAATIQNESASLSRVMHESFTGIRIIKGYNLEKIVGERFRSSQGKFIGHSMRVVRATESPGPIIEFSAAIGVAILLVMMAGQVSLYEFLLFVFALLALYKPIKSLVRLQSDLQRARAATARVFEMLATKSTLFDPPNPIPLKAAGGDIHFDNVSFAYDNKAVLRNLQLRIQPGEKVALVGKSGSGKTTMANLLLRFYDPTQGAIRIAGVDLREASMDDLRRQMAVVTQEVVLFADTIRNNIALGRAGATDAEIENAARHAYAHEFIMEKQGGYDFNIGERGTTLSVGQRQRLTIARALLRNAPILVLDEATSALDNEAEKIVQKALDELMKGRTTLCIAHRLSTIQNFDRIAVMDAGQIVEMGTHTELLAKGGIYSKLYILGSSLEGGIL